MPPRFRTVLPIALTSAVALTTGLVLASPGDAAPLPTTYSVRTSADLWHINELDLDMSGDPAATDLSVFRVAGLVDSAANPRSQGEAANLAGSTATGTAVRRATSRASATTDTSNPTSGIAPAGTSPGTLDVEQATLGARGRWVGDRNCLTTADGLADATAVGGGAELLPTAIPSGSILPPIVLTGVPTELPSTFPTDDPTLLPTELPTVLPTELSTTSIPTELPTLLPTELPTLLPTTLPPIGLPRAASATQSATADVVMAAVTAGTVQTRADLPTQNGATADVRGVRAQTIGTVKDVSAPAMTFFGGEVEVRISKEARLTAYADGVHPSAVVWAPPTVTVTLQGQPTTYTLPANGAPLAVSYSQNSDVTLTLTAGALTKTAESASGLVASGKASVMHMVVRNGDAVALDADFMPMAAEAKAPGGGLECPAPDTDGDGLSDPLETKLGTMPGVRDTDRDGLTDGQEHYTYRTNPLKADTDKDKLKDGVEVKKYKTKPRKADTDGDKLKDGIEVKKYKTNPRRKDTDRDGVNDNVEIRRGTNPLHK